jgi:uncharacterized protein (DUF3820 family)
MSEELLQPCSEMSGDPDDLLALAAMRMPFGKYRGRLLIDLPEPYVVWFANKGFPEGRLGRMLRAVYEIKVNGLEYLFTPLRRGGATRESLSSESRQLQSIRQQKK